MPLSVNFILTSREIGEKEEDCDGNNHERGQRIDVRLDLFLGHGIDQKRQGLEIIAACEITDDEVVKGHRESHDQSGDDAGHDYG